MDRKQIAFVTEIANKLKDKELILDYKLDLAEDDMPECLDELRMRCMDNRYCDISITSWGEFECSRTEYDYDLSPRKFYSIPNCSFNKAYATAERVTQAIKDRGVFWHEPEYAEGHLTPGFY